jgi:membrane protease YdiL (CAAX protease family)
MDESRPEDMMPDSESISAPAEHPSALRRVFQNRFGHWRAGWRILVYLIAVYVFTIALRAAVGLVVARPDGMSMHSWYYTFYMAMANVSIVVPALLVLRYFDRRPMALLGIGFERGWWLELVVGVAAGVVSTGALTLLLVLTGQVELSVSPQAAEATALLPKYLALFTVAAAAEEFIFRGYLLQAFSEGSRRWLASVLLSLSFAVVHLSNPDLSFIGVANIFLIGIVIAILYFQTLRLWLPIGYHLAWNWAHGCLWGFDVSGIEIEHQVLKATPIGPDVVTGGGFGLEGSILTTLAILAVGVWLLMKQVLVPVPEMVEKWAPYPMGFGLGPEAADGGPVPESSTDAVVGDGDGDGLTPDSTR